MSDTLYFMGCGDGIIRAYSALNSFYRFYGCLLILCITFAIKKNENH